MYIVYYIIYCELMSPRHLISRLMPFHRYRRFVDTGSQGNLSSIPGARGPRVQETVVNPLKGTRTVSMIWQFCSGFLPFSAYFGFQPFNFCSGYSRRLVQLLDRATKTWPVGGLILGWLAPTCSNSDGTVMIIVWNWRLLNLWLKGSQWWTNWGRHPIYDWLGGYSLVGGTPSC